MVTPHTGSSLLVVEDEKTHHVGYITFAIIEIGNVRMFCYSVWVIDMI